MKQRRCRSDIFVVYSGDVVIASGTIGYVAKKLKISERTVAWYATPRAEQLFVAGKIRRIAVRISAASLEKQRRKP